MKTVLLLLLSVITLFSCQLKQAQNTEPATQKTLIKVSDTIRKIPARKENSLVSRTLIIYYDEKTGSKHLMDAVQEIGADLIYEYKTLKGIAVKIPEDQSVESAITFFKKVKGVSSVHRDRIYSIDPPVRSSVR